MRPRDILTPAATLVGLVITTIGLSSVTGLSDVLKTMSSALVLIVGLFVTAATFTCFASLKSSHAIFRLGLILYTIGWIFTGLVLSLVLLSYAWGIQILQIRISQLPNLETLVSAISAIISLLAAIESYRRLRIDRQQIAGLTDLLTEDRNKTNAIVQQTLKIDTDDPKMAVVRLAMDLESILRKLAISHGLSEKEKGVTPVKRLQSYLLEKNAIDTTTANALELIRKTRNIIVHSGGDVSREDALVAMGLAAAVLEKLSRKVSA
jgi:hypothetical protein